ncbi:MAG TPA: hypothetical protein VNJ01_12590 [Bacteriovoracaceae bacterium]|nr:hypothetical protein [Bacteriovoracaceae bacterium]
MKYTVLFFVSLSYLSVAAAAPGPCEKLLQGYLEKTSMDFKPGFNEKQVFTITPKPVIIVGGEQLKLRTSALAKLTPDKVTEDYTSDEGDYISKKSYWMPQVSTKLSNQEDRLDEIKKVFSQDRFTEGKKNLHMKTISMEGEEEYLSEQTRIKEGKSKTEKNKTLTLKEVRLHALYEGDKLVGLIKESSDQMKRHEYDPTNGIFTQTELDPKVKKWGNDVMLQFSQTPECQLVSDSHYADPVINKTVCDDYFAIVPPGATPLVNFGSESTKPEEKNPESCVLKAGSQIYNKSPYVPKHITKTFWKDKFSDGRSTRLQNFLEQLRDRYIEKGNIRSAEGLSPVSFTKDVLTNCLSQIVDPEQVHFGEALKNVDNWCTNYSSFYKDPTGKGKEAKGKVLRVKANP